MNTIEELMKSEEYMYDGIRVVCSGSDRWLVYNNDMQEWIVYQRVMYAKKTTIVYSGQDLSIALSKLMKE